MLFCSTAFCQKTLKTEENLNGVKSIRATIDLGTVELSLRRVHDAEKAFRLDYNYSEDEKVPVLEYETEGERGIFHLSNGKDGGHFPLFGIHGKKDSANIELASSVPVSLSMNFGVCDASVDLGGMEISDATFSTGVCSFDLTFSSANDIECDYINVKTGISSVSVENLSNARARRVEINGGLGSIKVDFGGKILRDCSVSVKSGLGSVEISIPSSINTMITAPSGFLNSVDVSGFYSEGDGVYRSSVNTGPELKLHIDSGLGGVTIKSY